MPDKKISFLSFSFYTYPCNNWLFAEGGCEKNEKNTKKLKKICDITAQTLLTRNEFRHLQAVNTSSWAKAVIATGKVPVNLWEETQRTNAEEQKGNQALAKHDVCPPCERKPLVLVIAVEFC